jgi:hypothetical protein
MDSQGEVGATVVIQLSPDPTRLAGSVRVNDGPNRGFDGWLELMRELEGAQSSPRPGSSIQAEK